MRPTLTTAKGIESATTERMSGWLSEHRSSGVRTPKLESGPVQGWLCHTASVVAGAQGRGCTASAALATMSGITKSSTTAVSPRMAPRRQSTTSRSSPAASKLTRRITEGASTSRLRGWELRIAESAGVRAACAAPLGGGNSNSRATARAPFMRQR